MAETTSLDVGLEEMLVELLQDERFIALRQMAERDIEVWAERFAMGALQSKNEIDQREVDYKRGWYDGVMYYLKARPQIAITRLRKHHERSGE